jgi:RNA polymerase sigma factor for flagellar operon FliA
MLTTSSDKQLQSIGPDPAERERLLTENLPEVRYIARRIHDRLPSHVQFDDLLHAGILGLIDAVDKFDPRKNVLLKSYARFRIRGAILDSLRQLDWSPRNLRRQARRIEEAHRELAAVLGHAPTERAPRSRSRQPSRPVR